MSRKKDPEARANRVTARGMTSYEAEPGIFPPLPEKFVGNPAVSSWYSTYQNVPWADRFTATEVQFILGTLPLVAAVHDGELKWAAELRRREEKLGATYYDRLRLDIRATVNQEPAQSAPEIPAGLDPALVAEARRFVDRAAS